MTVQEENNAGSLQKQPPADPEFIGAHFDRLRAEALWCHTHLRKQREAGNIPTAALCGEHWQLLKEEMQIVAAWCSARGREPAYERDNPVEAKILVAMAKELARAGPQLLQAVSSATKLLVWLPHGFAADQGRKLKAMESVVRLPILDSASKVDIWNEVRTKPGRRPSSRKLAVPALEMFYLGKTWAEIERVLIPDRRNASNLGKSLKREVQFLKALLRKHDINL